MAMAELASRFYGCFLSILLFLCYVIGNEWHYPSCIVVDPDSYECLNSFFNYYGGYNSAIGGGENVEHTWVRYMDYIYDYNDVSSTSCHIRRQSASTESFTNVSWTRDGFSTCTIEEVSTFNTWWGSICEQICVEDNNCRRYATYLGYHLWNNCSWDAETERPNYDLTVP
ncbi:uncharacterized protein LOC121422909 [Lytechinus variegatus]|uniref:uncharacterized protein LOC121422909 n=1 Tax=Lytechinus variegatus TaxID=7654 RepID=UPI001BB14ED4|nr:uncharacterized protein LOC121422909 [Lytechinus variegatus]